MGIASVRIPHHNKHYQVMKKLRKLELKKVMR